MPRPTAVEEQASRHAAIPIWLEPARGAYPDPRLFQLSGMDRLRALGAGRWPRAPMAHLAGLVYAHADATEAVIEQPASRWFLSSQGVIPGGFLAAAADFALTLAATARVPALTPMTTSEISMSFMRPATPASHTIRAHAVAQTDAAVALAESRIEDGHGELLAQASARVVIQDSLPPIDPDAGDGTISLPQAIEEIPAVPVMEYDIPSPIDRPVLGETLPPAVWESATGREIVERQIAGSLPMPPIHHLTGMRPAAVEDGAATMALPSTAWLTSSAGTVLGGFVAMLSYSAVATAIQATTEPGTAHVPVDLKVNLLRPVYPDPEGRDLVAHGEVVHRGRSLRVADAEVLDPDGKLVAVARGTSMLLPGRAAWAAA